MIDKHTLLRVADAYMAAAGVSETTVSHRVFRDSGKLRAMRAGADITVGRFNAALRWFAAHWPAGAARPDDLTVLDGLAEDAA